MFMEYRCSNGHEWTRLGVEKENRCTQPDCDGTVAHYHERPATVAVSVLSCHS